MLPDTDDQTDHRQWTQQHLDAADLRISSMAPTPPQGEIDADCMDVNVRGPGKDPLHLCTGCQLMSNPPSAPAGEQPHSPTCPLLEQSHCHKFCTTGLLLCVV